MTRCNAQPPRPPCSHRRRTANGWNWAARSGSLLRSVPRAASVRLHSALHTVGFETGAEQAVAEAISASLSAGLAAFARPATAPLPSVPTQLLHPKCHRVLAPHPTLEGPPPLPATVGGLSESSSLAARSDCLWRGGATLVCSCRVSAPRTASRPCLRVWRSAKNSAVRPDRVRPGSPASHLARHARPASGPPGMIASQDVARPHSSYDEGMPRPMIVSARPPARVAIGSRSSTAMPPRSSLAAKAHKFLSRAICYRMPPRRIQAPSSTVASGSINSRF
jgi:hypothetical protein